MTDKVDHMKDFINSTKPSILPYLNELVKDEDNNFFNTRIIDDDLLDKVVSWKDIHRTLRLTIIYRTLTENFGMIPWSGKSHKVLCRKKKK